MKTTFIFLIISLLFCIRVQAQYGQKLIEDGTYETTVKYSNYKTSTYKTYTLDVKIKNDKVSAIYFPDGGSVHDGYNNSGYTYSGGSITQYSKSTKVTVYYSDGDNVIFEVFYQ